MNPNNLFRRRWGRLALGVVALASMVIIACGGTAAPTAAPAQPAAPAAATTAPAAEPVAPAQPAAPAVATVAPASGSAPPTGGSAAPAAAPTHTPVPTVQPTPRPTAAEVVASRDDIVVVINEEPSIPDPWLSTTLYPNQVVHNVVQPISFFGPDFTDTATAGFTGFDQVEPNTWRLSLREGVKFHNGEDWNAEAAAYTINQLGSNVEYQPYSQVREARAEIIDDLTVDFICESACPVLPRFGQFHIFVAPGYHQDVSQEDRDASGQVIGWGPYMWDEWVRGEYITLTAFDGYVEPQPVDFITQAPTITDAQYIWREEETVRSAMIQTGEADLSWAVSIDQAEPINNSANGKTVKVVSGEVYTINVDTIWHPELRKLEVRQALTHAIDCEELALAFFGPESRCSSGPNGIPGTLGVNEENAAPIYPYNPERARELLASVNYDPENEIEFWTRAGRYAKDVEITESLITFWNDVGLNVTAQVVEGSVWRDRHLTGPAATYDAELEAGATSEEAAAAVPLADPPRTGASPGLVFFAPGGEYFDFGRQINFYMSCAANRSKNCNAEWHELGQRALAASGEERRQLMTEAYGVFTQNLLQLPMMEIVSVWGVNKDLEFVNMPGGRRILINTMTWTN